MPFPNREYGFDYSTLLTIREVGAVYGLFEPDPHRPGFYICLYVGETDNLRRRLFEHYNNPPVGGVTHFFAEINPIGNRTRGG